MAITTNTGTRTDAAAETPAARDSRLWHPFADMSAVRGNEFVISRAEGVWLWDDEGRRYLDATASLWYANVGHGRREIIDAIHAQMLQLDAYSIFGDYVNEPARQVALRIAERAPVRDARVFLTSGGGDSIDTAVKLARQYWSLQGQPQRTHVISRIGGYHGTHGFGTSIGGIEVNGVGYGPLIPNTSLVPFDAPDALEAEIVRLGAENVAAFFCEPVIGAGGVHAPPDTYMERVAAICRDHGVLLVADSVICAFGRLGTWFGVERWGIEPDMITFAKGVTSGYQPLGGVVVSGEVSEPFWDRPGTVVRHGATYSGHPAACAAALANMDILEGEGLIARGGELEGALESALAPLRDHPLVSEVRAGTGLMAAVEIDREALAHGATVAAVAAATREQGVLVRPLASSVAVSPPLTVDVAELELLGGALRDALDVVADAVGR